MLKRGFQFAPGYRLQEFLGRGQFGQVWRATAPGGAAAAVKFIDLSDGQGQKEYDGVRRVKQIRHANLMPITAIWLLDGEGKVIEEAPRDAVETLDLSVADAKGHSALLPPSIVEPSWLAVSMLLGGKSLQHRLRECVQEGLRGIPPKELISYMDESAKGLDFLNAPQHDLGEGPIAIQHSDVKPANIVLIGSSAVVCDFGLARILTRNQVTATSAAGTPAYMAPEAISGKPCRTSDQYSLAVTYYHLRTATLPVNEGSLWEVLDAHRQGKLQLGGVPKAEQDVLRKATDLNWEERFESSVEMVDALREALRVEGQTTPGFVPQTAATPLSSVDAASVDGDANVAGGDPTATLEVQETMRAGAPSAVDVADAQVESPAGQSLVATQPFALAEQSTDEGFLKETLPALDETPRAAAEGGSLVESVKRDPKLMIGVGMGTVVIILLAAIVFRPPTSETDAGVKSKSGGNGEFANDHGGDNQGHSPGIKPPPNGDPQELVREAFAILDTEENKAIMSFDAALKLDPGLELLASGKTLSGHKGPVMQMLQTPDAANLVTVADDRTPFVWRLNSDSETPIKLAGHDVLITCLAMSPDGGRLLTGGYDDVARVWDLTANDIAASAIELNGHANEIKAAAWKNESILVTASTDLNIGVWEIGPADKENPHGTVARSHLIPIQELITALASDPSGKWLVARTLGGDRIKPAIDVMAFQWDEVLNTLVNPGAPTPSRLGATAAEQIAFLAGEGKSLLVVGDSGGGITSYNADSDEITFKSRDEAHRQVIEAMRVVQVDGGDVVVTGSSDGSVQRSMTGTRRENAVRNFCDLGVGCVDVSADGRWIATGAQDGSVWLWDAAAGKEGGAIQFVTGAASVDSVLIDVASDWLIAGCDDGLIRMWNLKHAKLLALTRPTPPNAEFHGPATTLDSGSVTMR